MWRMEYECFVVGIPSRGSLKTTNIRAMAKLSLCIAANNFILFGFFKEQFVLLRRPLGADSNLDR
jgi:hypothetical protein